MAAKFVYLAIVLLLGTHVSASLRSFRASLNVPDRRFQQTGVMRPAAAVVPTASGVSSNSSSSSSCVVSNDLCMSLVRMFQALDQGANALPEVGLPEQNGGVCTISHEMTNSPDMMINGAECKSILCNYALFSTECTNVGEYLNLYEIMIPDKPWSNNSSGKVRSSSQVYADSIEEAGLSISGLHTHWTGTMDPITGYPIQVTAIHHYSQGVMTPNDFVNKTVGSLQYLTSLMQPQPNITSPTISPTASACNVSDAMCTQLAEMFKSFDANATVLPGFGLPSQGEGVCTITHQVPNALPLVINGAVCNSILCNNALFSTECTNLGQYLNLYEILLPDKPSYDNSSGLIRSSSQVYADSIVRGGLSVSGLHTHWTGTMDPATGYSVQMTAIHHYTQGIMAPSDFVNRTIASLNTQIPH